MRYVDIWDIEKLLIWKLWKQGVHDGQDFDDGAVIRVINSLVYTEGIFRNIRSAIPEVQWIV